MNDELRETLTYIKEDLAPKIFEQVENGNPADLGCDVFMNAYGLVYKTHEIDDNSHFLYEEYTNLARTYTEKTSKPKLLCSEGRNLVVNLHKSWKKHKILVYWLQKIFCILDLYHVKNNGLSRIVPLGLQLFKTELFDLISKSKIRAALIEQIQYEREGNGSNASYMRKCLSCLSEIAARDASLTKRKNQKKIIWEGIPNYEFSKEIFEESYLQGVKLYYTSKPIGWMSSLLIPKNFQEAIKIFEEESERIRSYENLQNKLLNIIAEEIVKRVALSLADILETGKIRMFDQDKRDEVKMMFEVFKNYETALQSITPGFKLYIEKKGLEIISDEKLQQDPIEYTRAILKYEAETDKLTDYLFSNHFAFQKSSSSAFCNFINKFSCSAPYVVDYSDYMMKKGLLGLSDREIDIRLSEIAMIFVWLYDKDIFINLYARLLAKRLLDRTSISNDAEKILIEKLKIEGGYAIVNKIYSIYQDISLSEVITAEFNQNYNQDGLHEIQFSAQILKSGCCPGISSEACLLPYKIQALAKEFSLFYKNKYSGRSITWATGLGTVEIRSLFLNKSYNFIVNPYQAVILLMFNNGNTYSVRELRENSKLSENTFKANFIKFFSPKSKIFNKESRGKTLNDEELITINENFAAATVRIIYIPKKAVRASKPSHNEEVIIAISERKQILDAIIVKIAKARIVMKHQELVSEVLEEVKSFKPQLSMIKAQIESLIEREFLARDINDLSAYHYVP
ncbi:unnamed protein product [Blepharisma stoltei]|uniref:Cullin family profile domain-containing protein n=1 Tax=Blepharisma stoltei TaxID=1481888 RepID=A0AAU9JLN2_9CILI|nr:unnamed protein product [Blepharisma stoltei]